MNLLRSIPVVFSILLLGAHFLRSGNLIVVSVLVVLPFLLLVRRPWVPMVLTGVLIVGGLEWLRTLVTIADVRQTAGQPWVRMAIIIGGVALITFASSLVFVAKGMRERYRLSA